MAKFDKWLNGLPADATVADAARIAVATRSAEVVARLPLAAQGMDQDPEHVHQLRVAARRTAAALKIFRRTLPEKQADRLKWSLRIARRAAGPARDLDVFLMRLQKEQALPGLQGRLYAQREVVQSDLQRACDKLKGGKKVARQAEKLVRRIPAGYKRARRLGKRPFAPWAGKTLRREASRFLDAAPGVDAEIEELHRFRIAAKRLRYSLEVLTLGITRDESEEAYAQLRDLQNHLGDVNDSASLLAWLKRALKDTSRSERDALNEMLRNEKRRLRRESEAVLEWWDPDRARRLAALLGAEDKQA